MTHFNFVETLNIRHKYTDGCERVTPPPRLCPHPVDLKMVKKSLSVCEIESSALTHLCLVSVTSNRNSFNLSAVSQEQIQILTACVV